jgi:hypothetical protein
MVRTTLIELGWMWLRYQPGSADWRRVQGALTRLSPAGLNKSSKQEE